MNLTTIGNVAREAGVVREPKVGLLIMGRKRPGFDPEWGALVKERIISQMKALPWKLVIPSQSIADQKELHKAVEICRAEGVTVLVLVQPTISDGRMAPILSKLWTKPLVLWATTEKPTGSMISANSLVGTHVMGATLRQLGHPLEILFGHPDEATTVDRLKQSILAVHGVDSIQNQSLGLVGLPAPGFIDFHADPVFISDALSSHLYQFNTPEFVDRIMGYTDQEIAPVVKDFETLGLPETPAFTTTVGEKRSEALGMQARYYKAFRDLFAEEDFAALAFRCWPDLPNMTGHWPYLALARLVSEGFPIAMEGDIDGALGSRIAESTGLGPVYLSDWLEHDKSSITIWHTGAAPFQLSRKVGSSGGPRLDVQFNNKRPTVVESTIESGLETTAFRLWRFDNEYHMTALEGVTADPKRELLATNGLFITKDCDIRTWFEDMVQVGMPHHLCVIKGHHKDTLRRIARMAGFAWV